MIYLRFFVIGVFVLFFSGEASVSDIAGSDNRVPIEAKPILHFDRDDASRRIFGALEFMGGLELSCADPHFGGISALRIQADGVHFLALSDRAYWIRGALIYKGSRPAAIADAEIAPVLGPDKKHVARWDTEATAEDGNRLYVGVEGLDRIPYFDYDTQKFPSYLDAIPFPPGLTELPKNGGLEALEFIPKKNSSGGVLVAFSEIGLDEDGNIKAYLIEGTDRKTFAVKRSDEFDISDAVLIPGGDLLILERKFDILDGVSMRIRRLSAGAIKPDTTVDGPTVVEADMQCQIDNMEAMSAHRNTAGEIILTLMSDDNNSSIQRNLLLQFKLIDK
jgi:hypothetical protein